MSAATRFAAWLGSSYSMPARWLQQWKRRAADPLTVADILESLRAETPTETTWPSRECGKARGKSHDAWALLIRTLIPEHVSAAVGWKEGLLLRHKLGARLVQPRPEPRAARGTGQLQLEARLVLCGVVQDGDGTAKTLRHSVMRMYHMAAMPPC